MNQMKDITTPEGVGKYGNTGVSVFEARPISRASFPLCGLGPYLLEQRNHAGFSRLSHR